jgi:hypothetical protein
MRVIDAYEAGLPLVVETGLGGDRLVAALLPLKSGGLIYADLYWDTPGTQPMHLLTGPVTGEGPWKAKNGSIRRLEDGDRLTSDWNDWVNLGGNSAAARQRGEAAILRSDLYLDNLE